jgi:hypothetical protein
MCFTLRLHTSAAPPRVGLTQALGGMESIHLIMVNALPVPGTDAFKEFGGATINVYTIEMSNDAAIAIAVREILAAGWRVESIEDTFFLTRADLAEEPDGLQYFEQALLDGIVLVFYTYPVASGESNAVH